MNRISSTNDLPTASLTIPTHRRDIAVIGVYFFALMLCWDGSSSLAAIPLQYFLKDTLRLSPEQMAATVLLTDIPWFFGFALGFLRDRWRPFGRGDRGYFLFVPPMIAAGYVSMAASALTLPRYVATMVAISTMGALLGAATNGLRTVVAVRRSMTGRLAVLLTLAGSLPSVGATYVGGWLQEHLRLPVILLVSGVSVLTVCGFSFWKPRSVFGDSEESSELGATRVGTESVRNALTRLVRTRAVYLPAAILFFWDFAPGWGTPLFYHLTNTVKLSSTEYAAAQAARSVGSLAFAVLYGLLCRRASLRTLLLAGTVAGVLGCPLFLLIHTSIQADIVSFFAGASCGVAVCAFYDLLARCCPRNLEGTVFMVAGTMSAIAADTSDVFGSWLYERGGFGAALAVTTVTTALILPLLALIPDSLTAPREGERLVSVGEAPGN